MRKFNAIFFAICIAAFSYFPSTAKAWGVLGHRVVGQIAQNYLSAKSKKAIQQILGQQSMAMVANWADFIKSDTAYKHLNTWHYVNLPEGLTAFTLGKYLDEYPPDNLYAKTNEMIKVLKNGKSTAEEKKFALRILIHLVGDMHQPLHTGRKEDLGGNRIYVMWFNKRSNLHRLWDEDLIDFQQLSYTEYAAAIDVGTPAQINQISNTTNLKNIIYESYTIGNSIYSEKLEPNAKLSYRYNYDWIEILNKQLYRAGIRLAKILNDIYT